MPVGRRQSPRDSSAHSSVSVASHLELRQDGEGPEHRARHRGHIQGPSWRGEQLREAAPEARSEGGLVLAEDGLGEYPG